LSRRWILLLGLIVLLVSQLTACAGEPEPTHTATPDLSPMEITTRAGQAMLALDSLHFTLEREGALVYLDTERLLAFKRAEGAFNLPDKMRAVVHVITAFTPIDIGMVILGSDQYITDPITGKWGNLPPEWGQFNLAVMFAPETGLQRLLQDGLSDLELIDSTEIDNQRHYHLTARASSERMSAMTLGFIGQGDAELEVWVGAKDFYVRRLQIVEPETDATDPTTWNFTFSKLGEPVEIKAPPLPNS
jgi:lipoprotein LprG